MRRSAHLVSGLQAAEPDPDETVRAADLALQKILSNPDTAIPPQVLADAYGMPIVPDFVRVNLVAGWSTSHGVLLTKTADGSWSPPTFVRHTVGGVGAHAGHLKGSTVYVFMTRKRLDSFLKRGDTDTGIAASATFGNATRKSRERMNARRNAVVQIYGNTEGISGGIWMALEMKRVDPRAEAAYYKTAGVVPESASTLLANLQTYRRTDKADAVSLPAVIASPNRLPAASVRR